MVIFVILFTFGVTTAIFKKSPAPVKEVRTERVPEKK